MWLNEFLTLLVAFPLLSSSLALERAETPPRGLVRVVNVVASGAAADSDPTDLQIGSEGSGCRPGTVSTVVAEDNTFMTLAFDDFQATVGPGATYKKRAFCRVTATLSSPGWGFDVDNVDFRGYYKLDKGVNASVRASYKFVEQKGKGSVHKFIQGPMADDHLLHQDGQTTDKEAHPCTGNTTTLLISLSVTLNSNDTSLTGRVQGDSVDGHFKQILNVGWRRC